MQPAFRSASLLTRPLAACFERCRRVLDRLAQAGRAGMAGLAPAGAAVSFKAFRRLSETIRLIAILEMRLAALFDIATGRAPPPAPAPDSERRDSDRPEPAERGDRPDRERFDFDVFDRPARDDGRPLVDLVAAVCRNLGFDAEATQAAQAPFAELEALLARPPEPAPASQPPARASDRPPNRHERRAAAARAACRAPPRARRRPP